MRITPKVPEFPQACKEVKTNSSLSAHLLKQTYEPLDKGTCFIELDSVSGAVFAVAGLRLASRRPGARAAGVLVAIGALAGSLLHERLPDPITDAVKQLEEYREGDLMLFSAWNPVFRVDVIDESPVDDPNPPSRLYLNHDGMLGASLLHFDGDYDSLRFFAPFSSRGFAFWDSAFFFRGLSTR